MHKRNGLCIYSGILRSFKKYMTTKMKLEDITLSETSQSWTNTAWFHLPEASKTVAFRNSKSGMVVIQARGGQMANY